MAGHCIPDTRIAVDFWSEQPEKKYHFLTSYCKTQIAGLTSEWKYKIYTSAINARFLENVIKVEKGLVRVLKVGRVYGVNSSRSRSGFSVTPIRANHCPGSVMFLFEGSFGRVLYTGHCRYKPGMLAGTPLSPSVTNKNLDVIYLDNTYAAPYCRFPSERESLLKVLEIIKENPGRKVLLGVSEEDAPQALAGLGNLLKSKIVVSRKAYRLARKMTAGKRCLLTDDPSRGFVHAVDLPSLAVDREDPEVVTILLTLDGLLVRESGPSVHVVPYSTHSSHSELASLVAQLQPGEIVPVVSGVAHCLVPAELRSLCRAPASDAGSATRRRRDPAGGLVRSDGGGRSTGRRAAPGKDVIQGAKENRRIDVRMDAFVEEGGERRSESGSDRCVWATCSSSFPSGERPLRASVSRERSQPSSSYATAQATPPAPATADLDRVEFGSSGKQNGQLTESTLNLLRLLGETLAEPPPRSVEVVGAGTEDATRRSSDSDGGDDDDAYLPNAYLLPSDLRKKTRLSRCKCRESKTSTSKSRFKPRAPRIVEESESELDESASVPSDGNLSPVFAVAQACKPSPTPAALRAGKPFTCEEDGHVHDAMEICRPDCAADATEQPMRGSIPATLFTSAGNVCMQLSFFPDGMQGTSNRHAGNTAANVLVRFSTGDVSTMANATDAATSYVNDSVLAAPCRADETIHRSPSVNLVSALENCCLSSKQAGASTNSLCNSSISTICQKHNVSMINASGITKQLSTSSDNNLEFSSAHPGTYLNVCNSAAISEFKNCEPSSRNSVFVNVSNIPLSSHRDQEMVNSNMEKQWFSITVGSNRDLASINAAASTRKTTNNAAECLCRNTPAGSSTTKDFNPVCNNLHSITLVSSSTNIKFNPVPINHSNAPTSSSLSNTLNPAPLNPSNAPASSSTSNVLNPAPLNPNNAPASSSTSNTLNPVPKHSTNNAPASSSTSNVLNPAPLNPSNAPASSSTSNVLNPAPLNPNNAPASSSTSNTLNPVPKHSTNNAPASSSTSNVFNPAPLNPSNAPASSSTSNTLNPVPLNHSNAPASSSTSNTLNPAHLNPSNVPASSSTSNTLNPAPLNPSNAPASSSTSNILNPVPLNPSNAPASSSTSNTLNPAPLNPSNAPASSSTSNILNPVPLNPSNAPASSSTSNTLNPAPLNPSNAPASSSTSNTLNPAPLNPSNAPASSSTSNILNPVPLNPSNAPASSSTSNILNPVPLNPSNAPASSSTSNTLNPAPLNPSNAPASSSTSNILNPVPLNPRNAPASASTSNTLNPALLNPSNTPACSSTSTSFNATSLSFNPVPMYPKSNASASSSAKIKFNPAHKKPHIVASGGSSTGNRLNPACETVEDLSFTAQRLKHRSWFIQLVRNMDDLDSNSFFNSFSETDDSISPNNCNEENVAAECNVVQCLVSKGAFSDGWTEDLTNDSQNHGTESSRTSLSVPVANSHDSNITNLPVSFHSDRTSKIASTCGSRTLSFDDSTSPVISNPTDSCTSGSKRKRSGRESLDGSDNSLNRSTSDCVSPPAVSSVVQIAVGSESVASSRTIVGKEVCQSELEGTKVSTGTQLREPVACSGTLPQESGSAETCPGSAETCPGDGVAHSIATPTGKPRGRPRKKLLESPVALVSAAEKKHSSVENKREELDGPCWSKRLRLRADTVPQESGSAKTRSGDSVTVTHSIATPTSKPRGRQRKKLLESPVALVSAAEKKHSSVENKREELDKFTAGPCWSKRLRLRAKELSDTVEVGPKSNTGLALKNGNTKLKNLNIPNAKNASAVAAVGKLHESVWTTKTCLDEIILRNKNNLLGRANNVSHAVSSGKNYLRGSSAKNSSAATLSKRQKPGTRKNHSLDGISLRKKSDSSVSPGNNNSRRSAKNMPGAVAPPKKPDIRGQKLCRPKNTAGSNTSSYGQGGALTGSANTVPVDDFWNTSTMSVMPVEDIVLSTPTE
ncbi:mucin-5AC-like isoform X2 [Bacillus rossius redtenbacheri]|uniref:mucin-5AC-like isoform X2 n=1 Tax=Bacillus rossius redtenbacheri TaxID=93214 RepID=UPI002FDD0E8A